MFCPKCGNNNSPNAKFCAKCGGALQMTAATPTPAQPAPVTSAATGDKTETLKWGIIIGSVFVPLVGIVMGAIYFFDANASAEKKSLGKLWLMVGGGLALLYIIAWSDG